MIKEDGSMRQFSVQQLLSCNSAKVGCKGGNMAAAASAFAAQGLDFEADAPYQCFGGNSLHHFDAGNKCYEPPVFPWGAECQTSLVSNPDISWEGAMAFTGEDKIKTAMTMFGALYCRCAQGRSRSDDLGDEPHRVCPLPDPEVAADRNRPPQLTFGAVSFLETGGSTARSASPPPSRLSLSSPPPLLCLRLRLSSLFPPPSQAGLCGPQ